MFCVEFCCGFVFFFFFFKQKTGNGVRFGELGSDVGLSIFVLFFRLVNVVGLVKVTNSGPVEGYDHAPRPALADEVSQ